MLFRRRASARAKKQERYYTSLNSRVRFETLKARRLFQNSIQDSHVGRCECAVRPPRSLFYRDWPLLANIDGTARGNQAQSALGFRSPGTEDLPHRYMNHERWTSPDSLSFIEEPRVYHGSGKTTVELHIKAPSTEQLYRYRFSIGPLPPFSR